MPLKLASEKRVTGCKLTLKQTDQQINIPTSSVTLSEEGSSTSKGPYEHFMVTKKAGLFMEGSASPYYLLCYQWTDTGARYRYMLICFWVLFNMLCLISLLHSGGFFINVTYSSTPNKHRFPPQHSVPSAHLNKGSASITSLSRANVTPLGRATIVKAM